MLKITLMTFGQKGQLMADFSFSIIALFQPLLAISTA
jgi:hypothetical protein